MLIQDPAVLAGESVHNRDRTDEITEGFRRRLSIDWLHICRHQLDESPHHPVERHWCVVPDYRRGVSSQVAEGVNEE
jgi:hypothetical protein